MVATARGAEGTPRAGSSTFTAEQVRFFEEKVRPILETRCLKCHGGGGKVKGGFRVDSRAAVLKGGDLGPAIDGDRPEQSLLLRAIRYEELEMPPGGKLPSGEQEILNRWVQRGVPWGSQPAAAVVAPTAPVAGPASAQSIAAARREWSHRPVLRPAVPEVKGRDWVRNPIDAFVRSRLEAERLHPAPEADRVTLIRRLAHDLTGLPPTPEEVDAFLADREAGAYERLVDRLLASPAYGEHWARHWLDLVRYGETNGYERDSAKPMAWRYRDYVIDAFNRDKPYDRFVREQLAGDLDSSGSAEALIATGFYRLGIWDDEPSDRALARYDALDGVVSTTGQVFLGITINCARCHDHKVDPIPQADYYRLLAFFNDVTDQDGKNLRAVQAGPGTAGRVEVMCVAERPRGPAHVLLRGNPALLGPEVGPGVPEVLGGSSAFPHDRGKRLVLAEWLTDPRNPRTARVLANRLWQYHFGRGIVPTPNDFGKLGEAATHPELLDWLAAELVAGGWRLKPIHRLIVLSSAYRMSSRATPAELTADPSDRWLWRFPMRRLTAEEVRDAILAVSGELRLKAGGPSVCPPIPREVLAGQSIPGKGWDVSTADEAARRSVFIHVKRSLLVPILATHDAADTDASCPVRYTTTVPTQALGLLNGEFANEQAARLADRLRREAPGDPAAQIRRALRLTAAREPGPDEVRRDLDFLRTLRDRGGLDDRAALTQYSLMVLNANAFFYVD
jgi:hypothetical protein